MKNDYKLCKSCGMAFFPCSQAINTCNHCLAVIASNNPEEEAEVQACGEFAKQCDDDDLLRKELCLPIKGLNRNQRQMGYCKSVPLVLRLAPVVTNTYLWTSDDGGTTITADTPTALMALVAQHLDAEDKAEQAEEEEAPRRDWDKIIFGRLFPAAVAIELVVFLILR